MEQYIKFVGTLLMLPDALAVTRRAARIIALPGFEGPELWLTLYLSTGAQSLTNAATILSTLGITNMGHMDGGFLYPKLPVAGDTVAIVFCSEQAPEIAALCNVKALGVDLGTSLDPRTSLFKVLIDDPELHNTSRR